MEQERAAGARGLNSTGRAKPSKEDLIVPATATAANSATEAAVNAARSASASVNSYVDAYTQAVNRNLEATQKLSVAWLETAYRYQFAGLNVLRQALGEATRIEGGSTTLRPTAAINVARYALDEAVELQRESRKLVDELANTLKVGQETAIELAEANFRLVQSGLTSFRG